MHQSERAGEILKRFFDFTKLGSTGEQYVTFFGSWQKLVGTDLAAHSQVADIRNGAAIVEIDHPAWMQQFQFHQASILRRIQQEYAGLGVKSIHMKLVDRAKWSQGTRTPIEQKHEPHEPAAEDPQPPGEPTAVVRPESEQLSTLLSRLKKSVDQRERERRKAAKGEISRDDS
ncbi:MAG TPA: DciA family protein [Spirochaetia bacterium]|nr:DciA family protein [Spirochaetia bacterium]